MIKYKVFFTLIFCLTIQAQQNHHNLIIGTYTNGCQSDGMYVFDFDSDTAIAQLKESTKNIVNPSFLTFSADKKYVYSTNENGNDSQVSAFRFYSDSGNLQFLNSKSSEGNDPCFIINDEKNVLVANYSGGNITVFGKNEDGTIGKYKQIVNHLGKSINEKRQEKSHMHQLQFSPDGKYVLANDLGTDFIYSYRYYPEKNTEVLETHKAIKIKAGSGPRHLTFSPDGKFVYLLQELDGTLTVFKYDEGNLTLLQETTVVDKKYTAAISAADIHISGNGKFLYASNRGDANTISCFEIKKNGKLKLIQTTSALGKGPRNFTIDPSGKFLLVAHQYTNEVVIFSIDKNKGTLTDSGRRIALCSPVCLVFE